jgi:hypothetical protein
VQNDGKRDGWFTVGGTASMPALVSWKWFAGAQAGALTLALALALAVAHIHSGALAHAPASTWSLGAANATAKKGPPGPLRKKVATHRTLMLPTAPACKVLSNYARRNLMPSSCSPSS